MATLNARHLTAVAIATATFLAGIGPAHADKYSRPYFDGHKRANKYAERDFEIRSLSTRPNTVSGGDVLIEVRLPRYALSSNIVVRLNGKDVSNQLTADSAGGRLIGLVTGLHDGKNRLTVSAKHHHRNQVYDSLEIINYPIAGGIFAPHQRPWVCETEASGLGPPPASGPCLAPTRYEWFYRNTSGELLPLPSTTPPFPADIAKTTTIDGKTVDYIVRVESGTIDESIYRIAILDDPTNPISNPWSPGGKKPGPGWNGKLFYHFIGGAGPGFRSGRNVATSAIDVSDTISVRDEPIRLGFAVALGSRNTFGVGADEVVSAETVMMIKEHFIEQYGLPKYTVSIGSSGGAIQQHLIAHNYPGLLDAITPVRNYPDVMSVATDVIDCGLLNNYFATVANPGEWPGERQSKVTGYPIDPQGNNTCVGWDGFARNWPVPTNGFDAVVPVEARYDPVTNPDGARGTLQDADISSLGINPKTGFARQPYDNVGVQYGLKALNDGDMTKEEFLDLNEKIGGLDIDGNFIATRSEGDLKGIEHAYRYGRVNDGENLTLPMIQYRNYVDFENNIHTFHRSTAMLERLQKQNGTTDNVVRWTMPSAGTVNFMRMALLAHDQWLENIAADTSNAPYRVKVIRGKPASLKNECWDEAGNIYDHPFNLDDPGVCNTLYPVHADPRIVAGGPRAGDILKCRLKSVKFSDYSVAFTLDEQARLRAIFPQGVCDWSKPGVMQRPLEDSWLAYPRPGHAVHLDRDSH
jgi:hypothetical protein